jgi:hypothetical protein
MERSHPKSAPLTKGLLILSSCLVKIAHFANHLWSLRAEQCIWERCLAASGRLGFILRQFAADVGTLTPSNGWLCDASHCVIGEHPMLPWLALTFTAARLGFEAQNAAAFRFMRLGSRPQTAAGEIIPHAVALPEEAPALAVAAQKRRPAAKTSKKSAPAKRQRKRSKGR